MVLLAFQVVSRNRKTTNRTTEASHGRGTNTAFLQQVQGKHQDFQCSRRILGGQQGFRRIARIKERLSDPSSFSLQARTPLRHPSSDVGSGLMQAIAMCRTKMAAEDQTFSSGTGSTAGED